MASTVDERTRAPLPGPLRPARWWQRLVTALPLVAFLTTFGAFFVHKNRAARSVLSSGRGLLVVAAIVAGYLVIAVVLRRWAAWSWLPPVVLAGVVLGLAAWIVRPYYVDRTADRRLLNAPVSDQSGPGPVPSGSAPTTGQAVGPVRVSTGTLRGIGHDASGSVSLIRNADGSVVARFESFDIEGSPDPVVYVAQGADVRRPAGRELGRLRGTRGAVLDYAVPTGTGAGPGWTVLVWCRAFSVPIANASQRAI